MNYSVRVLEKMALINQVLTGLGSRPLGENDDFQLDTMWNGARHVQYDLVPRGRDFLPVALMIDEDFIRFDIAGFAEVLVWTNDAIAKSQSDLIAFVTNLFSSQILVDSIDGYVELTFLDSNNRHLDKMRIGNSFNKLLGKLSSSSFKRKTYRPLYDQ